MTYLGPHTRLGGLAPEYLPSPDGSPDPLDTEVKVKEMCQYVEAVVAGEIPSWSAIFVLGNEAHDDQRKLLLESLLLTEQPYSPDAQEIYRDSALSVLQVSNLSADHEPFDVTFRFSHPN